MFYAMLSYHLVSCFAELGLVDVCWQRQDGISRYGNLQVASQQCCIYVPILTDSTCTSPHFQIQG